MISRRSVLKSAAATVLSTGLQNSEHFRKKEDVKAFYQLGQRCSQLT